MNNFQYVDKLRLTTPKATLKYPKLIEPETKFSPEGHYKVTAVIPAEDAGPLADQLDALYEAHKASLKAQAPGQKFKAIDPSFGYEDIDGKPCFTISVKMKAKGMDRDGRAWSATRPCSTRQVHRSRIVRPCVACGLAPQVVCRLKPARSSNLPSVPALRCA
jgi:hypothetical protein